MNEGRMLEFGDIDKPVEIEDGLAVGVSLSKDGDGIDLIIITREGAESVRSVAELINRLIKRNVDVKVVTEKVVPEVAKRLRFLQSILGGR